MYIIDENNAIVFSLTDDTAKPIEDVILSTRHNLCQSPLGPPTNTYGEILVKAPKNNRPGIDKVVLFQAEPDFLCSWGLKYVTKKGVDEAYKKRGLIPADWYSLCAINSLYPDLSLEKPNLTHWRIGSRLYCLSFCKGKYCISCSPAGVLVRSRLNWFAGIRG